MAPAARKATSKVAKKATDPAARPAPSSAEFTAGEREAMRERAREFKAGKGRADGEADLLAKVAAMPEPDRGMATRLHAIVREHAPQLSPKTWYGMPAYANAAGKVVCFFQPASKFGARYATFGFNDAARLDDGAMWPTAFALVALSAAGEQRIAALVRQAAG